jgi:hypothetical protein
MLCLPRPVPCTYILTRPLTDQSLYCVRYKNCANPKNGCGTLAIFHAPTETIGVVFLQVIHRTYLYRRG